MYRFKTMRRDSSHDALCEPSRRNDFYFRRRSFFQNIADVFLLDARC